MPAPVCSSRIASPIGSYAWVGYGSRCLSPTMGEANKLLNIPSPRVCRTRHPAQRVRLALSMQFCPFYFRRWVYHSSHPVSSEPVMFMTAPLRCLLTDCCCVFFSISFCCLIDEVRDVHGSTAEVLIGRYMAAAFFLLLCAARMM